MISVEWNKNSLNNFYSKMNKIISEMPKKLETATEKSSKLVQKTALEYKRGSSNVKMIPYEIKKASKTEIESRIYTDKETFPWASFLEFGTGRYAEREHIGKTRTFIRSGFYFWYAPADKVKKQYQDTDYFEYDGEMFPMNAYMNGKKYVMVFEQKAQPFMRTAAFETRDQIVTIFKLEIKQAIGGVSSG